MRDRARFGVVFVSVGLLLSSCGAGGKSRRAVSAEDFECKERRGLYAMTGSIMYAEQGVRMTCDGDRPYVEEYFVTDSGEEEKRGAVISADGWEKAWRDFENAGWRRLADCDNPAATDKDPIYTFEIADGEQTATFTCKGTELPFPFDTLRAALDSVKGELPTQEGAE